MKKIALIAFIIGVLMAILAYVAQLSEWQDLPAFMTVGFAGYVLIISAAAYYLTSILYEWSKETEAWQG
jgi:hypothetical protein